MTPRQNSRSAGMPSKIFKDFLIRVHLFWREREIYTNWVPGAN
jgi:hypothetical protein